DEVMISCNNELQKSFVDEERIPFAEILKSHFHNAGVIVTIHVDESLRNEKKGPEVLTQRQQWERMIKKYPLVKELKDNLNLDLG
ncbi:MAG: hypothetical protein ACRDE2_05045, partial [Chitinophagaceae bacterium]